MAMVDRCDEAAYQAITSMSEMHVRQAICHHHADKPLEQLLSFIGRPGLGPDFTQRLQVIIKALIGFMGADLDKERVTDVICELFYYAMSEGMKVDTAAHGTHARLCHNIIETAKPRILSFIGDIRSKTYAGIHVAC